MHFKYIGKVNDTKKMKNFEAFMGRYNIQIINLDKIPDSEDRMRQLFLDMIEMTLENVKGYTDTKPLSFSLRIDSDVFDYSSKIKFFYFFNLLLLLLYIFN